MTQTIQAVALSAALLLVVSGLAKVRNPAPASAMLTGLRLPGRRHVPSRPFVRGAGIGEVAAGASAVFVGGRWALLAVACLYAAFLGIVLTSLARGSRASCGCFGSADAPLGRSHLVVDAVSVVLASLAAAAAPDAFAGIPHLAPAPAIGVAAQVLLLTWLAYLAITALPSLAAARRELL